MSAQSSSDKNQPVLKTHQLHQHINPISGLQAASGLGAILYTWTAVTDDRIHYYCQQQSGYTIPWWAIGCYIKLMRTLFYDPESALK